MRGTFAIIFNQKTLTSKNRMKTFSLYFEISYKNRFDGREVGLRVLSSYLEMFSARTSMLSNIYEIY